MGDLPYLTYKKSLSLERKGLFFEGIPCYRTGLMFRLTPKSSSLSTMVQLEPG